ncbi:MAG TPA: hypothetical protein VMO47_03415 [Rhodothermales bacterium]|nr:hypothetical protein [Rhodothermales bacterium]
MDNSVTMSGPGLTPNDPVGRVKLKEPETTDADAGKSSLGTKLLVGTIMVVLMIGSLFIILSGAFQVVPAT